MTEKKGKKKKTLKEKIIRKSAKTKISFKKQSAILLTGAFTLVAALAWNSFVQDLFNTYFSVGQSIWGKFGYALTVTIVVVIIVSWLAKIEKKEAA